MTNISKKAQNASRRAHKYSNDAASEPESTARSDSRAAAPAQATKGSSKQQLLIALLLRDQGATLDQMIAATGWLPHTTRAALTGLKKKGYSLSSDKIHDLRTYRAAAPE